MSSMQNFENHNVQLERLSQWGKTYQTDFVAHGVVSANVKNILSEGRLRCAENILRRSGTLEFEGGASGEREVVRLPNDVFSSELLEKIKEFVIKSFELADDDIVKMIRDYDVNTKVRTLAKPDLLAFLNSPLYIEFQRVKYKAPDLFVAGEKYKNFIDEIIRDNPELWRKSEKPRDLYAVPILAIYIDKLLPKDKNCKAQLRKIFNIYHRLMEEKVISLSLVDIRLFLHRIKHYRLADPDKINEEIRVYKNAYSQCYGQLRILVGGTERILASDCFEGGEHYLLNQGQNGGKFFKIDFSSSNVLLIGPKQILSDYAGDPRFGKNIIFSENIPKEWPGAYSK